jgi:hypothetical protein
MIYEHYIFKKPAMYLNTKKPPRRMVLSINTVKSYAFNRLEKSIRIGVATHRDEYVPISTPTNNANRNPLMDGPPKINMINTTTNRIIEVLKVRLKVVFRDRLMIS